MGTRAAAKVARADSERIEVGFMFFVWRRQVSGGEREKRDDFGVIICTP